MEKDIENEEDKVEIDCEFQSYKEKKIQKILIEKQLLKYEPKPKMIGNKILFLNCKNIEFYKKKLENPKLHIRLLRLSNEYKYTTKRFIETGYRLNIYVETVSIDDFEIIVTGIFLINF
jgi:hypothetical protein